MKRLIISATDFIFRNSYIFDRFRNFIHNNFIDEKNIVAKNFKKNKKTLDFGCGAGQFSVLFDKENYYGVDTDQKYIEFCKKHRTGNYFIIKPIPEYDFKDKYFDQILISSVIHHIENDLFIKILKELKRTLKDDGKLMIIDHFTKKNQKSLLCKTLIDLDRGKYFRDSEAVIKIVNKEFKIEKVELFKNSLYKDYMIILSKK